MSIDLREVLAVLERTPGAVSALLRDLPEAWITCDEGPDTFSPFDNVGHLIHGERTDWRARAEIILAQGPDRTFEPYDRFAQKRESKGRTMSDLLDEFASLRARNLEIVEAWHLTSEQLELTGEHPALGTVTLQQLLAAWVVHDLGHVAQISRVMAKRYRDAIGPWRQYLPIVDR